MIQKGNLILLSDLPPTQNRGSRFELYHVPILASIAQAAKRALFDVLASSRRAKVPTKNGAPS